VAARGRTASGRWPIWPCGFRAGAAGGQRSPALIVATPAGDIVPREHLRVPHEVDGSHGQFRAPQAACLLNNASND